MEAREFWYCTTVCKNAKYQSIIDSQESFFEKINLSINELTKNVQQHNDLYAEVKKQVDVCTNNLSSVTKSQQTMLKEINQLKGEVNTLQQEKISTKAIGFGVPLTNDENTTDVVKQVFAKKAIALTGMLKCYRMQSKQKETVNVQPGTSSTTSKKMVAPPIIFIFIDELSRNEFIKSCKEASKSSAAAIGPAGEPKINIMEMLTQSNKKLLDATRSTLKGKVKFIWTSRGKIYVRVAENDKYKTWIKAPIDIQTLLEKLV